jgi:hypothetical protein
MAFYQKIKRLKDITIQKLPLNKTEENTLIVENSKKVNKKILKRKPSVEDILNNPTIGDNKKESK